MPDLPDGAYTVAWRTLSSADGHTLQGYFGFSIGNATTSSVAPVSTPSSGPDAPRPLTRGLALLGLAALLAIAPMLLGVLGPAAQAIPGLADGMRLPLRRFFVVAAALAVLGSVAALGAQAGAVFPDELLSVATAQILTDTRYGQLWLLRLGLMLLYMGAVALALWGRARWVRPALIAAVMLALVLPLPFSLLSHAAAQQEGRLAAIAADALHLLTASVWGGGLFMLTLVLLPAIRTLGVAQRWAALRFVLPRFTMIALAAWGVLLLTGLYAAWLQVGTATALRETAYGQSLLLKGALLLPILALAAFHLKLGRSGPERSGGSRLPATIAAEALLVVLVLLVVGRLIGLEPAREAVATRTPPEIVVPLTFATSDGDREARLAISPGAAGINTFTIEVDGEPLPTGAEGVLRFELAGRAMGAQELLLPAVSQNRFQAAGSDVTLPGNWRIAVIVRAIGTFSWTTELVVPIGETPPVVPLENPGPRFAPIGIAGMVALAIGVAGLAAAAAFPGARMARRRNIAAASAVALIIGVVVLAETRLQGPDQSQVIAAQPALPLIATPHVVAHDDHIVDHHAHATPTMSSATPESLPGPGTTLSGDGISVTIAAAPQSAGPVTVSMEITEADGSPLTGCSRRRRQRHAGHGDGTNGDSRRGDRTGPVRERVRAAGHDWRVATSRACFTQGRIDPGLYVRRPGSVNGMRTLQNSVVPLLRCRSSRP